jgi:hypothetical protein
VRESDVDVSVGFLRLVSGAWVKVYDLALINVQWAMDSDVHVAAAP